MYATFFFIGLALVLYVPYTIAMRQKDGDTKQSMIDFLMNLPHDKIQLIQKLQLLGWLCLTFALFGWALL